MKKILSLLLVIGFAITAANAQRATTLPLAAGDTAVNTGTSTKQLPIITAGYAGAAIQVVLTRNSGAAGGSLVIQGSNDGSNWYTISSSVTPANSATQSFVFQIAEPLPVYLRSLLTGTGTMSVTQTVKYVYRKHD